MIYFGDSSGLEPLDYGGSLIAVGDYIYEEKQFTYEVEFNINGSWQIAAKIGIGQKLITKRFALLKDEDNYPVIRPVALDFEGVENSNAVRNLDANVSQSEVRNIVGGSLPISIDASANN